MPSPASDCSIKSGLPDRESWLKEGLLLQTDKGILLGEGPVTPSAFAGRGFFCPDFFFETKRPWIFPKKIFYRGRDSLENWLKESDKKKRGRALKLSATRPAAPPSFSEFHIVFARLKQKIKQGALKKAVPVFFEKIPGDFSVSDLLRALLKNTADIKGEGFLYGAWNRRGGFLGFTPEALFSLTARRISLTALAGTGPAGGPSLLKDPKEVREQEFVVQGIKEALKNEAVFLTSSPAKEKKFGSLKHLFTKIEGRLNSPPDFTLLCRKLHPTPALGGYPKQTALKQLRRLPGQKNRGFFGAPFGFFDGKSKGFCLVGIRSVEWNGGGLRVGAGFGLVENSILQKEWRELYLKRSQVKKFFSLN